MVFRGATYKRDTNGVSTAQLLRMRQNPICEPVSEDNDSDHLILGGVTLSSLLMEVRALVSTAFPIDNVLQRFLQLINYGNKNNNAAFSLNMMCY